MPIDPTIALGIKPPQIDSPMGTLGRMYQFREQQAQAQAREMQMRQAQQAEVDRQTLDRAYSAPRLTRQTAIDAAKQAGAGHLIPSIQKQFDDWDEAAAKRRDLLDKAAQAEQGYMARLIADVEKHNYDPMAARAAVDHAEATFGEEFAPRAAQYRMELDAAGHDPAKIKMFVEGIKAQDPGYAARLTAETGAKKAQTEADTATAEAPMKAAQVRQAQRADAAAQLGAAGLQSQAQYESLRNTLPYEVARLFPDKFDKDRVTQVGLTPEQAAVNTDRDLSRAQTGQNEAANRAIAARNATVAEGNLAERKAEALTRESRLSGPDALSAEARATAERWKSNQLDKLRAKWDDYAGKDEKGNDRLDEYEGEELRIENEYRAQVGLPRVQQLPWKSTARKGVTPAPAASVTPPGTLGALMPTPGPPAAQPKPPAAPATPPPPKAIEDLLAKQKPGTFKLNDGTIWRKQRDGSIVRVGR